MKLRCAWFSTAIALLALLTSCPTYAQSIVHLEVDGVEVASLTATSPPSAGRVNLGGRHPYGGCSSLYDNLRVVIDGAVVLEDDFSSGLGNWIPWGSPQPAIVSGCGNPDPCMRTNGDGSWPSGVCSSAVYNWTGAWMISVDVKVVSGHAHFNAVEFGVSREEDGCIENVEPCAVYVAWGDDHPTGEFKVERCQGGTVEAIDPPAYDEWHTVVLWSELPTANDLLSWGRVKALYE